MQAAIRMSAVLMVLLLCFSEVWAQSSDSAQYVSLPEGQLAHVLPLLAEQFQLPVIADSHAISQFTIQPVSGRYTLLEVLGIITQDLPIEVRTVASGVVLKLQPAEHELTQDNTESAPTQEIEKVVVVGERLSSVTQTSTHAMQGAFKEQLDARKNNFVFLSSANYQSLNASSSNTLADAFGFLSGLTVARDFGEGLNVSVKGLGPDYQATLLNGHPLAVNENVRDSGQSGRSFRFDVLPAQHVDRIDIIKSPTASMAEGGVGSTISVTSLRPLAIGERLSRFSLGLDYSAQSKKARPSVNTLQNWVNHDKSLGGLLSANSNSRAIRQDHFHTWEWEPNGNSYRLDGVDSSVLIPSNRMAISIERERRDTESFSLSTQWRPSNAFTLSAEHFYSSLVSNYIEQRWLARLDTENANLESYSLSGNSLVGATLSNINMKAALDSSEQRHINQTSIFDLQLNTQGWLVDASLARTSALSNTDDPIRRTRYESTPVEFSFGHLGNKTNDPFINVSPFPEFHDESLEHLSARRIRVEDDGHSMRFTMTKPLSNTFTEISLGTDWREQSRRYNRQDVSVSIQDLDRFSPEANVLEPVLADNFLAGQLKGNIPTYWSIPNRDTQRELASLLSFGDPTLQDLSRSYRVDERVHGGSASVQFVFGRDWIGEAGLRWQYWDNETSGFYAQSDSTTPTFKQFSSAQNNWLPSLSIRKTLNSSLLLKVNYGEAITLPSYADLQPGLSLNSTDGVNLATGGNPNLAPTTSKQFDAGLLWSSENMSLYLGGFHRWLNDYIDVIRQTIIIDGSTYQLSRPENLDSFSFNGVEVDFHYIEPWGGGIQINGVFLDNIEQVIESVARWHYKAQVFYETEAYAARLAFDVQQSHVFGRSATEVPDTYIDRQSFLSAQLSYVLSEAVVLNLNGRNLLDESVRFYFQRDQGNTLKEIEYIGRSFSFSIGVSF